MSGVCSRHSARCRTRDTAHSGTLFSTGSGCSGMILPMFLFGPFALWLPYLFFGAVFVCAVLLYATRAHPTVLPELRRLVTVRMLVRMTIGFRVAYALFLTYGQYYSWSQNAFTKSLLHMPMNPIEMPFWIVKLFPWVFNTDLGYLFFYSWGRFWLDTLLVVGAAALFFWFLRALERRNGRLFEAGEPEIGFLMALIVGWPQVVAFIPLIFVSVVVVSIFRRVVLKQEFTTLGWPFLVAALVTFVLGSALLEVCGLVVLAV